LAPADLAARLLALNEAERSEWLAQQRDALSLAVVEALKAQADADLYRDARRSLAIATVAAHVADVLQQPLADALAAWMRGNALLYLGQYHDCLNSYHRAREIYQQRDLTVEAARLRVNEIAALRHLGRYDEALAAVAETQALLSSLGPTRYSATLDMNAGILHYQRGKYAEALAAYEHGRTMFAAIGDETQVARMDVNRAITLESLDRYAEAEELLLSARTVLLGRECVQEVARVDLNLGVLAFRQARYHTALHHLESARSGFTALENVLEVAVVDLYRAHVYLALNLWPEALSLAAASQSSFAARGMSRQVALAVRVQGTAQRELGHSQRALRLFDQARRIFRQRGAAVEVALVDLERALLQRAQGKLALARRLARRAESICVERGLLTRVAEAQLIQAICAADQSHWSKAEALARQVLTLAESAQSPPLRHRAHHLIGQVAEARADLAAALAAYRAAIDTIETRELELGSDELRLAYLSDKLAVYEDAVRVALAAQRVEEAAVIAGRAAALLPATIRPDETAAGADDLLEQLRSVRREWYWRHSQLEQHYALEDESDPDRSAGAELQIRSALHALETELIDLTHRWQARCNFQRQPATWIEALREAQQALSVDALLVQYVVTHGRVNAIVTQRDGVHAKQDLCRVQHIERLVTTWRFGLESLKLYPPQFVTEHHSELCADAELHLRRLHDLLIAPLNLPPAAASVPALMLSVPPALHGVPFAVLHDGEQYLLERFQMAQVIGGLRARDSAIDLSEALIVGYSNAGQVPFAAAEARRVSLALEDQHPCLLLETGATEAAVAQRSQTASVIHLATHAAFRADNPFFSWIQLADARPTVADFYRARLARQPLVTLSACETGLGGPIGLGRALMAAGAQAVVASLWKIDDAATSDLMECFYRELLAGKSPAAALRAAQLHVRERLPHPGYWGGFVVMLPAV
jgi:tetratricopeptide (TPR) repeat protein